MSQNKIIAAGHICIDITPVFDKNKKKSLDEIICPGKLIHVNEADVHTGGSVANTGLALKLLGSDVSLIGKISNDSFGGLILTALQEYGAEKDLIRTENGSTSYSIVIAPPGTDRVFLHNPGCNDTFCSDDLDYDLIKSASHFHFGYPTVMRNMFLNDGKELVNIFKKVKELGLTTSLDMAAVDADSEAGHCDWANIIKNVLPYVDFFVPSIEELGFMIDQTRYQEWLKRANGRDITTILSIQKDIKPLADTLLSWGAKALLIKCGTPGMYFRTSTTKVMSSLSPRFADWGDLEIFENSYVPDQVLSGTGAGDTSIAAFLKAVLDGYSAKECLQFAAATGASCVTTYDALSGLKSFDELKEKINNGWEKQTIVIP